MDVMFHSQTNEVPIPASIKVDVSDVARNVASMGRLLRAGFDLHFTNRGHTCWMENRRNNSLANQNGHVLEKSSASLHGGLHDQSADWSSWSQEET